MLLRFEFKEIDSEKKFSHELRIEIRWSHGKFCGNPETKVYKEGKYEELKGVKNLF